MTTAPGNGLSTALLQILNNNIEVLTTAGGIVASIKSNITDPNGTGIGLESIDAILFPNRPGVALQAEAIAGGKGACMILYYRSGADAMFFTGIDI